MTRTPLFVVAIGMLLGGCRDDLSVNGQSVKDNLRRLQRGAAMETTTTLPPEGEVIDIRDGLLTQRTHVQTRTPISFSISNALFDSSTLYSLFNDTTKQTLLLDQAFEAPSSRLNRDRQTGLLSLWLYPFETEFTGKLNYGSMKLRLTSKAIEKQKASTFELVRRDFSVQLIGRILSEKDMQRVDGLELDLPLWHASSTSNGTHVLTMGAIPLFSR